MKLRIGPRRGARARRALALGPTIVVVGDGRQRRRALERDRPRRRSRTGRARRRFVRRRRAPCLRGWCTRRCTTPWSRSKAASSRSRPRSRRPPEASVDAAVAQAARDVLVARVPGTGGGRADGLRRVHGGDPGRSREGRRQGGRRSRRRGHARAHAWATASTTSSRTSSRRPGRVCSSRSLQA